MKTIKQLQVSIAGKTYPLVTDEDERVVFSAAGMIDSAMQALAQQGTVATEKVAVLVALQVAAELTKERASIEQLGQRVSSLIQLVDTLQS